jgi:hypothetical protein
MKRAIFFVAGILLFSITSFPAKVPVSTAEKVARNFIHQELHYEFNDLIFVKTIIRNNTPLCYYFNFPSNKGHIIVAADDHVHPILGYSENNTFQENDNFPPQYISWMSNYYDQIEYIIHKDIPSDDNIDNEWQALLNNTSLPNRGTTSVTPLLTTTWNQGCYYNGSCPVDAAGPCGRVLAGCGATAMAQIMKYHNWPVQGTGSHSYYHPVYGTLSADFGATTYNWAGMPNNVTSSNTSVATLLYHCGVSMDMDYGPYVSYSYATDIVYAYKTYFSYSPACEYYYKINYSTTVWENMIKEDLDNSLPVLYRGSGSSGGHLFVCDGYSGTNYFHFNWGWSGTYDGYYYLSNLNPGPYTFNDGQGAILDIEPLPCKSCPVYDFAISPTSSWQTSSSSHITNGCKIYRMSVTSGQQYIFKTGCGNGATAGYDTYLELYNSSCAQVSSDDNGCEASRSIIEWTSNFTGYAYLKVRGTGSNSGSYTLAYISCTIQTAPSTIEAAAASSSQIDVTWQNVSGETGYDVFRSPTPGGTYAQIGSTGLNVTTYSDQGLQDNSQYCYKVKAYNYCGPSSFSPYDCATTTTLIPSLTYFDINGGMEYTWNNTVLLNNSATNSPTHYKASENPDFSGASWSTYSTTPEFILSDGGGMKTVYLKVKNATGISNILIDTILYDFNGPPPELSLQNITITSGMEDCYNATGTITVAGNGTTFIVQPGGAVTLIAGQNIILLPGTLVQSGGYFQASITTSDLYCIAKSDAIISTPPKAENEKTDPGLDSLSFLIFPNPTSGHFTLLLNEEIGYRPCFLQVCGILGNIIFEQRLEGLEQFEFDLSGQKRGIYILHFITGSHIETTKLVKQ